MTISDALHGVRRVLLDTAPTIYALEANAEFGARTQAAVRHLFDSVVTVIATPITLAECRAGAPLGDVQAYVSFLTKNPEITFVPIDADAALLAGELKQMTKIKLPDCLQIARASRHGCDLLLTNDDALARQQSLVRVLLVSDLDP